jgi:hypothetical protein
MGKLISLMNVSLDGYIETPDQAAVASRGPGTASTR